MRRLLSSLCMLALIASWVGWKLFLRQQSPSGWTVPLPLPGGVHAHVHVPRLIRFVTSRWGIWLLDGRTFRSRWGVIRLATADDDRALDLCCSPCVVDSTAIDRNAALPLDVELRLAREGHRLLGRLVVNRLVARLTGTLSHDGLVVYFELIEEAVRDLYDLFAPAIPELRLARVEGTISIRGRLALPEGRLEVNPELRGFEVRGLGTDRLAWGRFTYRCGSGAGVAQMCRSGEGTPDWVALSDVGRWLPRAVVAAEDARFFDHPGYDLVEIVASLQSDLDSHRFHRGGSTITQQLARGLFLTQDKTVVRKLREILYAVEMEQTLGKKRLLALYLNTVEWGPGIHGDRQAALAYFRKEPKNLGPEEAAWLAVILRNPWKAWYTQFITGMPDAERVTWVVGRMKDLEPTEKEAALARCLRFSPVPRPRHWDLSPGRNTRGQPLLPAGRAHPGFLRDVEEWKENPVTHPEVPGEIRAYSRDLDHLLGVWSRFRGRPNL